MICSPIRELPGPPGQPEGFSPAVPYLPTTTIDTMHLTRAALLPALAGQNLVPEQALQVQEADEAGWGGPGGERAGQRPGTVCGLPARATRLEPQLLIREGLRRQCRLLHPQLHVVVPLGAPRSYAATATHVRLPARTRQPPSRFPSRSISPVRVPWTRRKAQRERRRNSEGRTPAASSSEPSLAPTPSPEAGPGSLRAQAQPSETAGAARRAREPTPRPSAVWTIRKKQKQC